MAAAQTVGSVADRQQAVDDLVVVAAGEGLSRPAERQADEAGHRDVGVVGVLR